MKTVTLKTDDTFFERLSTLASELHLSKSELIRRSVVAYEEHMQRQKLRAQLKAASLKVRDASRQEAEALEETLTDGLDEH
ncbi:MAG TPA: DNA-binding protein [Sulfuricurvum sp.]|nr:DNA-binding protein [Sulfuricurvum sp.]